MQGVPPLAATCHAVHAPAQANLCSRGPGQAPAQHRDSRYHLRANVHASLCSRQPCKRRRSAAASAAGTGMSALMGVPSMLHTVSTKHRIAFSAQQNLRYACLWVGYCLSYSGIWMNWPKWAAQGDPGLVGYERCHIHALQALMVGGPQGSSIAGSTGGSLLVHDSCPLGGQLCLFKPTLYIKSYMCIR